MDFEELKSAWQQQETEERISIDNGALLKLVQRNHEAMRRWFFGERFVIVVFGLVYTPFWIWMGLARNLPWSWYLEIPAFLWVVCFLFRQRAAQRRMQPQPGDTVRESVERSLEQVDFQIRLQNSVLWWYILPPGIPMAMFFVHCGIQVGNAWVAVHNLIVAGLILWGVYEIIRLGVRKNLEPRREELREFLDSLDGADEETESEEM